MKKVPVNPTTDIAAINLLHLGYGVQLQELGHLRVNNDNTWCVFDRMIVDPILDEISLTLLHIGFGVQLRELDRLYVSHDDRICVVFLADGDIVIKSTGTISEIARIPLANPNMLQELDKVVTGYFCI